MKHYNLIFRAIGLLFLLSGCNQQIYQQKQEAVSKTTQAADELLAASSQLKQKIEERVAENPNSSSEDFLEVVDQKIDEIEQIQQEVNRFTPNRSFALDNSQDKRDFEKIRQYQQKISLLSQEINAIYVSFDRELDKKLQSDVYFQTGSYQLSTQGKKELQLIVEGELKNMIQEWNQEKVYQDKPKKLKINIVGYADLQGSYNIDRRKSYNLSLSEKRAASVKEVIQEYLRALENDYALEVELQHEGKGEEPPPGLVDIEKVNNPDRRICTISSYVIPVF
ncbi:MAG: OmpA family protein [Candidatus Cyclobacteriaceae bacterium M3_2C_046]